MRPAAIRRRRGMPTIQRLALAALPITLVVAVATLVLRPAAITEIVVHAAAPTSTPPPDPPLIDRVEVLAPIVVGSLALSPIVLRDAAGPEPDLLVLDEALSIDAVEILESHEVGNLIFANRSNRDVLLLAGEVILGGHQDRIIANSTVLSAHVTEKVPVYCVEQGRWGGSSDRFETAHAIAHQRLRAKASFHDQDDVWAEVATSNATQQIASKTGTYRDAAARQLDAATERERRLIARTLAELPVQQRGRLVGIAASINGKPTSVDVFASPALFGKIQMKLLRAYLTDARGIAADPATQPPDAAAVRAFSDGLRKSAVARTYANNAAASETRIGDRVGSTRLGSRAYGSLVEAVNSD